MGKNAITVLKATCMQISLLLLPNTLPSSLFCLQDVLAIAGLMQAKQPWSIHTVSTDGAAVTAFQGRPLAVDAALDAVPYSDVVLLPSRMLDQQYSNAGPQVTDWLRQQADGGARIASVCTGAFALAETGLLDGLPATTHWLYAAQFRRRFPAVRLQPERALVDNGALLTAGAGMAWQDLLLTLLADHLSPAQLLQLRQMFLLQGHPHGQQPYIGLASAGHQDARVQQAQACLADHLADDNALAQAMQLAGLAPRTFQRRFRQATGYTAVQYLQQLRIEKAKALLLSGNLPVEQVGFAAGYGDGSFFRRLFRRHTGLSPAAYRQLYQQAGGQGTE